MARTETDLEVWLETLGLPCQSTEALSGDVSRRSYFRLHLHNNETAIAVRYPADMRSVCSRFLTSTALLEEGGVTVPRILEHDCERGFMLIEDLGDLSFHDLSGQPWDKLEPFYLQALDELRRIQQLSLEAVGRLNPALDSRALRRELDLAWTRLLDREEVSGPPTLRRRLRSALDRLCDRLEGVPLVPCHRDFMARNLLRPRDHRVLVVIDHQDLRPGLPVYDLASLLNDSLFPPPSLEHKLRARFVDEENLDLYRRCAVQRSLKAVDTFIAFATAGDRRHLPLVESTLAGAARHLARLPEGGSFAEDVASHWQNWLPD